MVINLTQIGIREGLISSSSAFAKQDVAQLCHLAFLSPQDRLLVDMPRSIEDTCKTKNLEHLVKDVWSRRGPRTVAGGQAPIKTLSHNYH